MPRGRPRKTEDPAVAPEAPKTEDPVERFREALNALISADPEKAAQTMAAVMGVSAGTPRKVEDRRRVVEIPKTEVPVNLEPLPPPKPGVVFASRHGAFRYVARPGGSRYDAMGNREIIPPILVDFENGIARVTSEEHIARIRDFIVKQRRANIEPQIVEIRDEIAEMAEAGRKVVPIQSSKVTADTPLSELVTA